MRKSPLLRGGTAFPARGGIRRSVGLPSRAHATGHFPERHPRRRCSCLSGRNPFRKIQKEHLEGSTQTMRSEVSPMRIEVLYVGQCPHHLPTMKRIDTVLHDEGFRADVREILVQDARPLNA